MKQRNPSPSDSPARPAAREEEPLEMKEHLRAYRDHLVLAEQKAQEDFDKTVLTLSGGALGISFAFVKDIAGSPPYSHASYLFWAWVCWGVSVLVVLASYWASQLALRKAIRQVDTGQLYSGRVGGVFDIITAILNASGAAFFFGGVILMVLFARFNLEVHRMSGEVKPAPSPQIRPGGYRPPVPPPPSGNPAPAGGGGGGGEKK